MSLSPSQVTVMVSSSDERETSSGTSAVLVGVFPISGKLSTACATNGMIRHSPIKIKDPQHFLILFGLLNSTDYLLQRSLWAEILPGLSVMTTSIPMSNAASTVFSVLQAYVMTTSPFLWQLSTNQGVIR